MENSIEEIERKIDEIEARLAQISNKFDLLYISDKPLLEKAQNELRAEYFDLNGVLDVLYRIDDALQRNPDVIGEKLDLYAGYRHPVTQACWYNIFLHGTKIYVGNIRYVGNDEQSIYGNVSYQIEEEHRGHGYALGALQLMSRDLYERGIEELFISALEWNKASIKTIEKFGGISIGKYEENIIQYKCNLSLILNRINNKK